MMSRRKMRIQDKKVLLLLMIMIEFMVAFLEIG